MASIFLSHASRDDAIASVLERWLRASGFDDLFVDHSDIKPGDRWTEALRRAKGSCRVVMCLVTPSWLSSDQCYGEFVAGWYAGKRTIPLLALAGTALDDRQQDRLRHVLREDQGLDLTALGAPAQLDFSANPDVAEKLATGLRAAGALAKIGLDPHAFAIDRDVRPEPFLGLESFQDTDADAALFFGRNQEIIRCLEDLREMRARGDARAYAILGASGSGKSSLMKAGVLVRLRRERGWFALRCFRPGADPLLNFADALVRSGVDRSPGGLRDDLLDAFVSGRDLKAAMTSLLDPLRTRADQPGATILISVDQAEELARAEGQSSDALGAYLAAVMQGAQDGEPHAFAIVLSIRTDSLQELQSSPRVEGLPFNLNEVRSLPAYLYDTAIEQPASRYGVEMDPALVEALMEDAGGKDALPLLAFALQRLWRQYSSEGRILRSHYLSVGKVAGLLEDAAERALRGQDPTAQHGPLSAKLSDARERLGARVFVPALAQVNERGAALRKVASVSAFDQEGIELLESFEAWRLLVRSADTVEVAHEAMFREWPRFAKWLEPEKARLEILRSIETAAASWASKARKRDDISHSGRRLREAQKLARLPAYRRELDANSEARDYLIAAQHANSRRAVWIAGGVAITAFGIVAFGVWNDAAQWRRALLARSNELITAFNLEQARTYSLAADASPGDLLAPRPPNYEPNLRASAATAPLVASIIADRSVVSIDSRYAADKNNYYPLLLNLEDGTARSLPAREAGKAGFAGSGRFYIDVPGIYSSKSEVSERTTVLDLERGETFVVPFSEVGEPVWSAEQPFLIVQRYKAALAPSATVALAQTELVFYNLATHESYNFGPGYAPMFRPDRPLAIIDSGNGLTIWRLDTGTRQHLPNTTFAGEGPEGRSGKWLRVFDTSASVEMMLDLDSGKKVASTSVWAWGVMLERYVYGTDTAGQGASQRDADAWPGAILDLETGARTPLGKVSGMAGAKDSGTLYVVRDGGRITSWDVATGTETTVIAKSTAPNVSRYLGWIAGRTRADEISVVDVKTGRTDVYPAPGDATYFIEDPFLVLKYADQTQTLYDLRTRRAFDIGQSYFAGRSPDGAYIVLDGLSAPATVVETATGKRVSIGYVSQPGFSPDGILLLANRSGWSIDIYRVKELFERKEELPSQIQGCSVNADVLPPFEVDMRHGNDARQADVTAAIRGRPWNPCDWRGLGAGPEGWAQWLRRFEVIALGNKERDYKCGEVDAAGNSSDVRIKMCRSWIIPSRWEELIAASPTANIPPAFTK